MENLYTNYYLTGASKVEIYVKNDHNEGKLLVKVLKKQIGVDWAVSEEKIEHNGYKTWTVTLDSSKLYLIKFYSPAYFSGYIKAI